LFCPFDVLPKVQPAKLPHEPYPGATAIIGRVFDATDTTYKFYWFLSLLEKACGVESDSRLEIPITDLGREMVTQGWYTRRQFRLWFGHQDRLQAVIDHLGETCSMQPGAELHAVRSAAIGLPATQIAKVLGFVPYRFVSPWFQQELRILGSDSLKNDAIRHFAIRSRRTIRSSPYYFDSVVGAPRSIILDKAWVTFLQSNFKVLRAFTLISLARFLEVRNPGVPGIINKLEKPQDRDLSKARLFWNEVFGLRPLRCIYSGAELSQGFAIDHFIPWSFVTHDLIWNLIPANRAANSSKSDSLPSFTHYLDLHIDSHYDSLQIIRGQISSLDPKKKRSLNEIIDQYTTLARGSDVDALTMSRDQFRIKLKSELQIQADLAKRLKFPDGWVWRQN
jgi:hypothetical protein